MEQRVKRGRISALILSVIFPGAGLMYVRKPLQSFFCALIVLLVLAGDALFHTFSSIRGMGVSVGLICAVWLYSTLAAMYAVGKGLSREQAARDLGPWVIMLILLNMVGANLGASFPYKGYTVSASTVSALEPGDRFTAYTGSYDEARRAVGRERLMPGDVVVAAHPSGETVSRIWGMAGDVLELRDGALFRNSQEVFRQEGLQLPGQSDQWLVPTETVFLWNDLPGQPETGLMSGQGARHISAVRGKVLYIYWSKDRSRLGTIAE